VTPGSDSIFEKPDLQRQWQESAMKIGADGFSICPFGVSTTRGELHRMLPFWESRQRFSASASACSPESAEISYSGSVNGE
jgi:hypothetical protein